MPPPSPRRVSFRAGRGPRRAASVAPRRGPDNRPTTPSGWPSRWYSTLGVRTRSRGSMEGSSLGRRVRVRADPHRRPVGSGAARIGRRHGVDVRAARGGWRSSAPGRAGARGAAGWRGRRRSHRAAPTAAGGPFLPRRRWGRRPGAPSAQRRLPHERRSDGPLPLHREGRGAGEGARPIEAYRTRRRRRQGELEREVTEDHMGDGHPRAAVATRLGQASLDARAVDHRVARPARPAGPGGAGTAPGSTRRPPGSARATAPLPRAGAHRRP